MSERQPRYDPEEHARLGQAVYAEKVAPLIGANRRGWIVAIDVDTGEFELAYDTLTAAQRLLARLPNAQVWCTRVGDRYVNRFSARMGRPQG